MATLDELAIRFGTDKSSLGHNYTPLYERHLGYMRDGCAEVLEIGVFEGASLRMWEEWLFATVTGIDINPEAALNEGRIRTVICDVKDYEPEGCWDLIVDDGSHDARDITAAAKKLLPRVNPGGWYVIEDLAVVSPDSSTFAWVEALLEDLATERRCLISEAHIYPQIVFLRRGDLPPEGETQ